MKHFQVKNEDTGETEVVLKKVCYCKDIQLRAEQTARLHISDVNEVTLRGQNPPLKCCQPFDFLCTFLKDLDLLLLKIWSL